jgi:(2R)-3-sulfolactate dehydrogenase (NADP+)
MPDVVLTPKQARKLVMDALVGAGASKDNVGFLADGIIDTELSGLAGHGFYRLQFYCSHVKSGKVDGKAKVIVRKLSPVAFRADARHGFAHPTIWGIARITELTSLIPKPSSSSAPSVAS